MSPESEENIVRATKESDVESIWAIIEPTIRAGETFALPQDLNRSDALAFWLSPEHQVFVVENNKELLGTYHLTSNHKGGGSHVANCGYIVAPWALQRGIATLMCKHSLSAAKAQKFRAMQFNFVLSSNEVAVKLWEKLGFEIVGRFPKAFLWMPLSCTNVLNKSFAIQSVPRSKRA